MTTINIRKRRQESILQKACREESPEKQNKKSRGFESMTGGEAANVLDRFWNSKPDDTDFPELVKSSTHAIKQLRRGLADPVTEQEYTKNIIESGLLAPIFFLLDLPRYFGGKMAKSTIDVLQFEAAWTLTNISSGESAPAVMQYPESLDILGRALLDESAVPNVREHVIWCIANLAGYEKSDDVRLRQHSTRILLHDKIIEGLISNTLNAKNPQTLKTGLWAIGNVILGRPSPNSELLIEVTLQILHVAFHDKDLKDKGSLREEIFSETFSSLRKAMLEHSEVAEYAGKWGDFVMQTIEVLNKAQESGNGTLVHRAIRCLGLLLKHGSDQIHENVTKHDFLREAKRLLRYPNQYVQQEACSALVSFVHSADDTRMKKFRARDCLTSLVEVVNTSPFLVKKQALLVILHFLNKADQLGHRHFFTTSGGTQVLCDSLKTGMQTDATLCRLALDAVETTLKTDEEYDGEMSVCEKLREYHGFETIEQIQNHHMKDIAEKAEHIIEEYFVCDENETDELDEGKFSPFATPIAGKKPFQNCPSLIS